MFAGAGAECRQQVRIFYLYRRLPSAYQAISAAANIQNSSVTNEEGLYAGLTVRPFNGWRLDAFTDVYIFPWLKFQVNKPSQGYECMFQLTFTPNKQVEIYSRYKKSMKETEQYIPLQAWRLHMNYKLNTEWELRSRCEMVWYNKKAAENQTGFLFFSDLLYQPPLKRYGIILRAQYFETEGYDARIYAYEHDVLYDYAIPAYSGKGLRYYLLTKYDVSKKVSIGFRAAQTKYSHLNTIGTGLEEIKGSAKSEIKLQVRWIF
jgi:hypothetical protein